VEDPAVQEHVSHQLPEHEFLGDEAGDKSEVQVNKIAAEQMGNGLQDENSNVTYNECLNSSGNRSAEEVLIHQVYARRIGGQIQSLPNILFRFTVLSIPLSPLVECAFPFFGGSKEILYETKRAKLRHNAGNAH
jgi:hypothetical protein